MPKTIVATDTDHLKRLVTLAIRNKGPNCDLNHIDVSGINDCPWSPQEMVRWASQELVRWAREEVEMGRALGMDDVQIKQLMVEHQCHVPTLAERGNAAIGTNFFEAAS